MISDTFLDILHLLGADYGTQIDVFPSYVHIPDEIALLFDDEYSRLSSQPVKLTPAQRQALSEIDSILEFMSGKAEYWTLDALRTDQRWSLIRELAMRVLLSLGEFPTRPKLNWIYYQRGG